MKIRDDLEKMERLSKKNHDYWKEIRLRFRGLKE